MIEWEQYSHTIIKLKNVVKRAHAKYLEEQILYKIMHLDLKY
jgi:hypothetical protein